MSSSTTRLPEAARPGDGAAGGVKTVPAVSSGAPSCRWSGAWSAWLDLGSLPPAPAGLFLVERLLLGAVAERGDIHRLEELVIVLAHGALAAVKDLELHAFERGANLTGSGDLAFLPRPQTSRISLTARG